MDIAIQTILVIMASIAIWHLVGAVILAIIVRDDRLPIWNGPEPNPFLHAVLITIWPITVGTYFLVGFIQRIRP